MTGLMTGPEPSRDPAFREHASGLIVPAELSRQREVWTKDEWRLLERATKLLASRGVQMFLGCTSPRCHKQPLQKIRSALGMTLRCDCKDREFTKAF